MSDLRRPAGAGVDTPHWVPSPLLLPPQQTPRFLRAPWDQRRADTFGPWRLGQPVDPALLLDEMPLAAERWAEPHSGPATQAGPESSSDEGVTDAGFLPLADTLLPTASPEALAEAEARGHARGLAEGRAQALAAVEAERAREAELIRHLSIEMRALADDSDRFFEPLRRLALHIAEQLVRSELRASPEAITQIVRQALAALDPAAGQSVLVCVHPEDAELLQAAAPAFLEGLKLQPEPQLHRGSVRLRLDDTVLEDLIEHRLQAITDKLLAHTGGAGRESVLTRDFTAVSPLSAGPAASPGTPAAARRRSGALDDVIDATARPVPPPPESAP